jgi:deazaflavin-dependent oxidoreductase (nitroreductase family)
LKNYFNPLTLRIARGSRGSFAIVRHVGRRSGKIYETPIIIQPFDDGFVIELTYGSDVDWYKNVLAAGGCIIQWHGKDYIINGIESLEAETGRAAFPLPERLALRLLGKKLFMKMKTNH